MSEEIFGPILPLFSYSNINEVIKEINARPKPLSLYLFSENSKNIHKVRDETSSGSFVVNEAVLQMANNYLPFGGVGKSGYGRYHGKSGFVAFSNAKSVCETKAFNPYPISCRFPPYT
jgi:acyl-CoA reductase-like NAD-dependent aldehyde dehydrogenase